MVNKDFIYKNIVMNANFGYSLNKLVYNESGKIIDFEFLEVNRAFLEMTGNKNRKIINKRFTEIFPTFNTKEINWIEKLSQSNLQNTDEFFELHSRSLNKWYKIKTYYKETDTFVSLIYDITDEISIAQFSKEFLANAGETINFQKLAEDLFCITNAAVIIFNIFDDETKTSITKAFTGKGKLIEIASKIMGLNLKGKAWKISEERYNFLKNGGNCYFPTLTDFFTGQISDNIISLFNKTNFNNPVHVFSIKVNDEIVGDFIIVERKKEKLKNIILIELFAQLVGLMFSHQNIENQFTKINNDLELVLDATENGYWDCDFRTNKIRYNDKYFTMLGYDPKDMPHTMEIWKSLMHPLDRGTVGKEIDDLILAGIGYERSFRLRCKNGDWKWILGKGKGFQFDETGKPTRALGIHIDIDNLKSIEEQLKDQENHYRALFEYSPTPLWELDFSEVHKYITTLLKTGVNDLTNYFIMYPYEVKKCIRMVRVLNVNNAVLKLFRFKNLDEISSRLNSIFTDESYSRFTKVLVSIGQHNSYCDFDTQAKTKDKNTIFTHLFWKVIPGFEPNLKKVFVATVEITERVLSAQKIQETKERIKSINDALPDMIFEMDEKGNFIYYNDQNRTDIYKQEFDFIGKNIMNVMPEDIADLTKKHIKNTIETSNIQNYEYSLEVDGKINHFESRMVPKGKSNVLAVVRNVTDRKILEDEYRLLEQHRVRSQKLETIGTLAGGIAHDFNNMLTPIMGYSDMIRSRISPESPIYEDVMEILNASKRAKELVEQMLSFSRESGTNRKPVFLSSLLKETMKFIRPALPDTIKISLKIEDKNSLILADAIKIHQVILNLATNAFHAMENTTGELSIESKKVILENKALEEYWALEPGNEYLQLTVSDTGCGMEKDLMDRIFEPFFTTKSAGKGTGMGLSVVHGIMKSHKGAIQVESQPGKGTTFTLFFPITDAQVDVDEISPNSSTSRSKSGNILLIDDREYISKMLQSMLVGKGYFVEIFNNSVDALSHFKENPKKYDLVITDRTMPDLTGIELAEKINAMKFNIPVILITGQAHDLNEEDFLQKGIRKIIQKPILFNELINAVDELLAM